jgi:NADH-quinone oxidoreductase subunit H
MLDIIIIFIKAFVIFNALLGLASIVTWVERKASALIQDRQGANRAAILGFDFAGLLNTLIADPVKAVLKEDFLPRGVSQFKHCLAPFLAVFPVIVSFAVVPFGPPITIYGHEITLSSCRLKCWGFVCFCNGVTCCIWSSASWLDIK